MKKHLLLSLIAAFMTVLGVSAQSNSYNMVIEMTDGTKINIGPNDIQNMTFIDGELTVSGESIDDIKREIENLKKKIDEQNTCECSAEIEALKKEIADLNTSDIVAMINVLQMQIKSLMDEIEKLKNGGGNNNQGGNNNNQEGDNNNNSPNLDAAVFGTWQETLTMQYGKEILEFKFDEDGKCYYNEWDARNPENINDHPHGTWSTKDGYLYIDDKGYDEKYHEYYDESEVFQYTVLDNGNTLKLVNSNYTYTLTKQ